MAGTALRGVIRSRQPAVCVLRVASSQRVVCVINRESDAAAGGAVAVEANKYLIDFDYPLSVFLSFCLGVVIDADRLQ